jgi:hypothetical protein
LNPFQTTRGVVRAFDHKKTNSLRILKIVSTKLALQNKNEICSTIIDIKKLLFTQNEQYVYYSK